MIDKEMEGSKTVIVRGKEFSKRAAEGLEGERRVARGVFTSCSDVTLDQREQVGGRRKGKKEG